MPNPVNINGQLDTSDLIFSAPAGGGDTTRVDRYDLELTGAAMGQPIRIDLSADLPDNGQGQYDPFLQVIDANTGQIIADSDDDGPGFNALINAGQAPSSPGGFDDPTIPNELFYELGRDYEILVTSYIPLIPDDGTFPYFLQVSTPQGDIQVTPTGSSASTPENPNNPSTPENPNVDPLTGNIEVRRFWDERAQAHIFTADPSEINALAQNPSQFRDEGVEFRTPSSSTPGALPVYEYENVVAGTYFYTLQPPSEITPQFPDLRDDGIAFYAFSPNQAQPEGTVPVHRFFNQAASQESGSPVHFFTGSESNMFMVMRNFAFSFTYENAGWFAFPGDNV